MHAPSDAPRHRWVWPAIVVLITLLALALRWYYVTTTVAIEPIRNDAMQYYTYAWNLIHHGVFSASPPGATDIIPSDYRDPGYPLLLALWMKLFRDPSLWYAAVLLSQALLGALTVPLAMQVGRRWLGWRWVAVAGVLMALWPHNIAIAANVLSETLFGFLCALALWLCARACGHTHTTGWAIAAGVCLGAAALTNAVLLPFGVVLALYLGSRRLVARRVWLALCVGSLVLPSAWAVRNAHLPAQPPAQTSLGRALQNFVIGSFPEYHTLYRAWTIRGDSSVEPTLNAMNAESALAIRDPRAGVYNVLARVRAHPTRYLLWYALHKPAAMWGWGITIGVGDIYVYPVLHSPFETQRWMRVLKAACFAINPLLGTSMLVCLLLTLLNAARGKSERPQDQAVLESVLLLVVFVTLVYSALQAEPRYSIPFRSFEMLLAATGCSLLVSWIRQLRGASATSSSTIPPA